MDMVEKFSDYWEWWSLMKVCTGMEQVESW
jgi:hypothetical protein